MALGIALLLCTLYLLNLLLLLLLLCLDLAHGSRIALTIGRCMHAAVEDARAALPERRRSLGLRAQRELSPAFGAIGADCGRSKST